MYCIQFFSGYMHVPHTSTIYNSQDMEATPCPSVDNELRRCGVYTHTHTQYYSAVTKNEILPFAAMWMDRENIMLSEIRDK